MNSLLLFVVAEPGDGGQGGRGRVQSRVYQAHDEPDRLRSAAGSHAAGEI